MNTEGNIIIFFGPPGAGKGSISKLFIDRLGFKQLSTGNLCREHIASNTKIGKEIDLIIKSGKLISDSIIIDMVDGWLKENLKNKIPIILDGFPRTLNQAKSLADLLKSYHDIALHIIRMIIPDEAIVNRLASRTICTSKECQAVYSMDKNSKLLPANNNACDICGSKLIKRADDNAESILERVKIYREHESKIVDFYKNNNQLYIDIQVSQPLENIYSQLIKDIKLV